MVGLLKCEMSYVGGAKYSLCLSAQVGLEAVDSVVDEDEQEG